MARWTRTDIGYALLFSVPPGLGMAGFVTNATGGGYATPPAVVAGVATTAVVFGFVLLVTAGGEPDPARD